MKKLILRMVVIFLVLSTGGCGFQPLPKNPLESGWTYALGEVGQEAVDTESLVFEPVEDLMGLERFVEQGFLWLKKDLSREDLASNEPQALLLGRITIAHEAFWNGALMDRGGRFPPNFFSGWNDYRYIPLPDSLIETENTLLIKIYINGEGAVTGALMVGPIDYVRSVFRIEEFFNSNVNILIFILMIVMSAYHFLMYFKRRRDRENLYYGVLSLSFGIYLTNFFITKIPGLPGEDFSYLLFQKIIFLSLFISAYGFASFVRTFLGYSPHKIRILVLRLSVIIPSVLVLVMPSYFTLNKYLVYYQVLILVPVLLSLYFEIRGLIEKKPEATVMLWGLLPLAFTTLFDLIVHQLLELQGFIYLSGLGMPLFLIAILFILAGRFVEYHNEVEVLNRDLEKKVEKRTEELQKANSEIEMAMEELSHKNDIARKDMDMAAAVQSSLYPQQAPETENWSVSYLFKPMSGVSGDLFDFYLEGDRLLGVSLLDVSGHGIASGLITLVAKSVARRKFYMKKKDRLHQVLGAINEGLTREIKEVDNYLTGIFLRFQEDIVEYVNAGHTELLHKSRPTGKVHVVNQKEDFKGWFLGIPDMISEYTTLRFRVGQGDFLLLYTDCLIETPNEAGEAYGQQRLEESLERAPQGNNAVVMQALMKDFDAFRGKVELSDDLTLLLIRKK